MRAAVVHDADPARAVAERDQPFAEQHQPQRRAVALQFRRHYRRDPVLPHHLAHWRAGADAKKIVAVFVLAHSEPHLVPDGICLTGYLKYYPSPSQKRGSRASAEFQGPWIPAYAGMTAWVSRPIGEAEPGARAGGGAVAGDIMRPGHVEVLDGTADADPHADLGAAGIELFARQRLQRFAVLVRQGVDDPAVELFVDDKMAEPARADDADASVIRIALDRLADRLAELPAAPRRRLVRRVIGVEEDRHDRQIRILHQPLAHKGVGVTFAVPGRQTI